MLHGISWAIVQRMMIDAPTYDTDASDVKEVTLTQDNNEQILNFVNSMM